MRLENNIALITVGGMGRASAWLFAQEGATVCIAGRNQERDPPLALERSVHLALCNGQARTDWRSPGSTGHTSWPSDASATRGENR